MTLAFEVVGAIASALTIFTAGVAVGKYLSNSKNDRR